MLNFKQMELSRMLFRKLKEKFPEIELINITPTAYNPDSIWVNIIYPEDEDREIELGEMASEITTDILLDYGYNILISPEERIGEHVTQQEI
ncbi:hypothetical protein QUF80_02950 [Desulfococcaceae bacterium HSG8]|nr:hypothetical protein [Desulfococcaceae bacterium HSG8]